jgi:hypothetical protein
MIVEPSATKARTPPRWSKWLCVFTRYLMGLLGTSFFASAITAKARSSFNGLSITVIYVGYSTTTL